MARENPTEHESLIEASVLSAAEVFRDLPSETIRTIESLSEVREHPAGYVFFHHGDEGEALFVLEAGHVQTFRMVGKRRLVVADLKPPAVFGEMACVGQRMYHCSAEATEPSRIRALSRQDMDQILHRFPDVTRRLLDLVSERFLQVLARLEDVSLRPLIPRLARLLLNRAAEDVVRDLTHKEIAQQLRVYRESATSALGELRKAGIISIERKCIRILDRPRLERASRE